MMWLRCAISRTGAGWDEGDLKTHQQRRVALDSQTADVLREHRDRCIARASALGLQLAPDAFVFSGAPDGSTFPTPGGLSQRYDRLADRLGIDTTLHKLRHYAATDLIAAGVDVRTVAGRLGHAGGGTTTLRAYTAWVAEADQRAASGIGSRMPARPVPLDALERAKSDPQSPYEKIAAELRRRILSGDFRNGDAAPTEKQVAAEHGVAAGTAHRAMELLKTWGLVKASRGHRAVVIAPASPSRDVSAKVGEDQGRQTADGGRQYWSITLRGPDGRRYPPRHVFEDITRPDSFRAHLVAIARIETATEINSGADWIGDYELEVRDPGKEHEDPKLTLRWQGS